MTFGALYGSELYLQFPTIRDTEANPTLKKATDTKRSRPVIALDRGASRVSMMRPLPPSQHRCSAFAENKSPVL
jgi:hypothetical protein